MGRSRDAWEREGPSPETARVMRGWKLEPLAQTMTRIRWPRGMPVDPRVLQGAVKRTRWPSRLGWVEDKWQPGRILCDYDGPMPAFSRVVTLLRLMCLHPIALRVSRSRRGWHLLVLVRERLSLIDTVAVQAVLGSDSYREAFNLARARTKPGPYWAARANLLFGGKVAMRGHHGKATRASAADSARTGSGRGGKAVR